MQRAGWKTIVVATSALVGMAVPAFAFDGWHLEQATVLESSGSAWDYVSIDPQRGHLFMGHRKEGLQVFDLATRRLLRTIDGTPAASSNGAVIIADADLGISSNEDGSLIPFSLSTLEAKPAIKLGEGLDSSHYDPVSKRIVVNMEAGEKGTDLQVLDVPSLSVVGTIALPSRKLEGADADGHGAFYVAARDTGGVFKLDTKALTLTAQYLAPGCEQANSVAVDSVHNRVFLACRGGEKTRPALVVFDGGNGTVLATLDIGAGVDAIAYDPDLRRVFLTVGVGALLHVVEQVDADHYRMEETVGTRAGVRTMAWDPTTKKLHAVVSEGAADFGRKINTATSPWYANSFVPNTFTVLTYGR